VALAAQDPPSGVESPTLKFGQAVGLATHPARGTALPHVVTQTSEKKVTGGIEQAPPAGAEQLHEHVGFAALRPS
jgi:hypothetical protein